MGANSCGLLTRDGEGSLAGMRIHTIQHPAVLLAFADGVGLPQSWDSPAAQCLDRLALSPVPLSTQIRDSKVQGLSRFARRRSAGRGQRAYQPRRRPYADPEADVGRQQRQPAKLGGCCQPRTMTPS